ncbi:MAG: D-serine ammonia-lyase [Clostridia bacterium]|nr:D-serine ammonia-lyase [Clostridia bacterium]
MQTTDRVLERLRNKEEQLWQNPALAPCAPFDCPGADAARDLFARFAPCIEALFPGMTEGGRIASPLDEIPAFARALAEKGCFALPGRFFLKRDDSLPVVGSVKARGGIAEVLTHAERLVKASGILPEDASTAAYATPEVQAFLSRYAVEVGSTGNLGLSIGTMSAALGFTAVVHMSHDARQWKKELLRARGAKVVEYAGDYGKAVSAGRASCAGDPMRYFVDDERSETLFWGYAAAAKELAEQLAAAGVTVDAAHPLIVYLPCGVGGAPGGVTYGLKSIFGDAAHCFFAEPVGCPCMLLGLSSGKGADICVQDIGLDGRTEADGLACGRPSPLVVSKAGRMVSGVYTVADERLYRLLGLLYRTEGTFIEPSACASLAGPVLLARHGWQLPEGVAPENITHVAWSTGGGLVPGTERAAYLARAEL